MAQIRTKYGISAALHSWHLALRGWVNEKWPEDETHKSINHRVVLTDFSRRRGLAKPRAGEDSFEKDGAASISRFGSVSEGF